MAPHWGFVPSFLRRWGAACWVGKMPPEKVQPPEQARDGEDLNWALLASLAAGAAALTGGITWLSFRRNVSKLLEGWEPPA